MPNGELNRARKESRKLDPLLITACFSVVRLSGHPPNLEAELLCHTPAGCLPAGGMSRKGLPEANQKHGGMNSFERSSSGHEEDARDNQQVTPRFQKLDFHVV